MAQPQTSFDWPLYADATFAGLSVLIPVVIVDWLFEEFFRRRIPAAVARRRGQVLSLPIITALNRDIERSWLATCLLLPLLGLFWLLKRLSKKILYFLTVKEATDKVSYYWHWAFLIDYALSRGHLSDQASAQIARQAMDRALQIVPTSPLRRLANQVISNVHHIFRTLRGVRRGTEDEVVQQTKSQLAAHWADFAEYFRIVAQQYDQAYQALKDQPQQV
jgi:hypothetical protein